MALGRQPVPIWVFRPLDLDLITNPFPGEKRKSHHNSSFPSAGNHAVRLVQTFRVGETCTEQW